MRLSILVLMISMASLALSSKVSALGLGEITLNSALNEPLDAQIRLLQVRELTEDEILVGLASNADFDRVGVDKSFFLTGMKFSVDLTTPDGPIVKITTNSPVREPFLNFLVESQWPSGRILREYTLLMDLPTFSAQAPSAVQAPAPAAAQPSAVTSSPVTQTPAVRTRPVAPQQKSYAGESYGPVSANDTLWDIALKVRPSSEYSAQQTMIAIQRLNPDAFINDNINLLRRGQVLRIPDGAQIRELNFTQAVSEVAFQNDQWGTDDASKATLVSDNQTPSTSPTQSTGGRISLGVADDSTDGSSTSSGTGSSSDNSALQSQLGVALEELDTANRENSELRSKIAELDAQIETMERLVEVSSAELRALQAASAKQSDETSTELAQSDAATLADGVADLENIPPAEAEADVTSSEDSAETNDTLGTDESASVAQLDVEDNADNAVAEQAEADQTEVAKPDARTVVTTGTTKKPGLLDTIMDNIVLIAAVLIALIVAAFVFIRKFIGGKEEELEDTFNPFEEDPADVTDLEDPLADVFEETEEELAEEPVLEFPSEEEPTVTPEEDNAPVVPADVIAETDIYIAYGKYDQAEEMLEKALAVEPDNNEARLKLLEVHAGANNLESFDKTLATLHETADGQTIERGAKLRSEFKDAAPFALGGVAAIAALGAGVAAAEPTKNLLPDDDITHRDLSQEFAELDDLGSAEEIDGALEDFDFDLGPEFDEIESLGEGEDSAQGLPLDEEAKLELDKEIANFNELESLADNEIKDDVSVDETEVTIQRKLSDEELEALESGEPELDLQTDLTPSNLEELASNSEEELDALSEDLDAAVSANDEIDNEAAHNETSDNILKFVDDSDNLQELESDTLDLDADLDQISEDLSIEGDFEEDVFKRFDTELEFDEDLEIDQESVDTIAAADLEPEISEPLVAPAVDEPTEELMDGLELDEEGLTLDLDSSDFDEAGLDVIDDELQAAGNKYDNLESDNDFLSDSDLELDIPDISEDLPDQEPTIDTPEDDSTNHLLAAGAGLLSGAALLGSKDENLDIDGDEIATFEPFQDAPTDTTSMPEDEAEILQDADLEALDEEMDALAADVSLGQLPIEVPAENASEIEPDENFNSDDVFAEVLASTEQDLSDIEADDEASDDGFEDGMDFLADADESDTKLDLARAYIDMGDGEGAKDILNEVLIDGNDQQKEEAQTLIDNIPS